MDLVEKIRPLIRDYLPANGNWFRPEHICDGLLLGALNMAVGTYYPRIAGDLPKARISMKDYLSKVCELLKKDGGEG